jgi:uncharacterized protein YbbK (DUF523 family)
VYSGHTLMVVICRALKAIDGRIRRFEAELRRNMPIPRISLRISLETSCIKVCPEHSITVKVCRYETSIRCCRQKIAAYQRQGKTSVRAAFESIGSEGWCWAVGSMPPDFR